MLPALNVPLLVQLPDVYRGGGGSGQRCAEINLHVVVSAAAGEGSAWTRNNPCTVRPAKPSDGRRIIQSQVVVGGETRGQRLRRGAVVFDGAAGDGVDVGSRRKRAGDPDRVDRIESARDRRRRCWSGCCR